MHANFTYPQKTSLEKPRIVTFSSKLLDSFVGASAGRLITYKDLIK
jgi:hypothetical protein